MSSVLSSAITHAMSNANTLKSNIGDWSDVASTKAIITASDSYKQTPWGATFTSLVGEQLLEPSILDIGSGKSATFKNLIGENGKKVANYVSIDIQVSEETSKALLVDVAGLKHHKHIQADIFELPLNWFVDHKKFDVVIIDIEPHGREIDVYDVIADNMKDIHLIILKCVGFIDLMGSAFADRFLYKLMSEKRLVDFFGVSNLNLTRDVFIIASRKGNEVEFDGCIRNRLMADGGKHRRYWYKEICYDSMLCEPSEKVVNELM